VALTGIALGGSAGCQRKAVDVLTARVAIVAGAGGALGRASATTLAARGLTVVAVDRNGQALRELPGGIRREVADTTDQAAAKGVTDRIAADVGPPDILVNTIGAFGLGDALATTPETLRLMMDSASKAALVHLTRILDVELRPHGIRVNVIVPQLLDTQVNRANLPPEALAHAVAPEAIAEVIAFLVSDAAAPVSGAIIPAYGA
jgi:NAD(P)-dependent dehydrogenase (short-subunit alcohol dehydrogenase family)